MCQGTLHDQRRGNSTRDTERVWYSEILILGVGMSESVLAEIGRNDSDPREQTSAQSALTQKSADGRLHFGFLYKGIPFVVRAEANDLGTDLSIIASLGNLPYSAEDRERRSTALAILDAAKRDLGGLIRLNRKQRLELVENFRLEEALTPTVLLTRTARIVLRAKPYLELLSLVVKPPLLDLQRES